MFFRSLEVHFYFQITAFRNCCTFNFFTQIIINTMESKTIGEQRVGAQFNASKNSIVDEIKQKTAELINLCEELKVKDGRLALLAQTEYENAAMWAVKAATA